MIRTPDVLMLKHQASLESMLKQAKQIPKLASACLISGSLAIYDEAGRLQDWSQLQATYREYHALAGTNADLRALFIAYSAQSIHRINLFADGAWALLGAILAGMGLHGLCSPDVKASG